MASMWNTERESMASGPAMTKRDWKNEFRRALPIHGEAPQVPLLSLQQAIRPTKHGDAEA